MIKTNSSDQLKSIITILVLLSSLFFGPIAYTIGVVLMWKLTSWPRWLKIIISLPLVVLLILSILVFVELFVVKPVQVKGQTMLPNYKDGEFLITKVLNKTSSIQRGEVVIFTPPANQNIEYIKRVIAIPGDKIEIKDGKVYLNSLLLNEQYLSPDTQTNLWQGSYFQEGQVITLSADKYFVMGDNRTRSSDSRQFGPVSKNLIHGKVLFCYWNCK